MNTFQLICGIEKASTKQLFVIRSNPRTRGYQVNKSVAAGQNQAEKDFVTKHVVKKLPQDVTVVKSFQKSNWSLTTNGEKKKKT